MAVIVKVDGKVDDGSDYKVDGKVDDGGDCEG